MKKIMIISLLSLILATLAADYNKDFEDFAANSFTEIIGSNSYWTYDDFYFDEDDAIDMVAKGSLLLLYAQAGWEMPKSAEHQKMVQKYQGVASTFLAIYADEFWLINIDMKDILKEFNNSGFKALEKKQQLEKLSKYIYNEGDWSEYYDRW